MVTSARRSLNGVPAPRVEFPQQVRQVDKALGDQVADVVRALPLAIHTQQRSAHHFLALGFNETGPDDDVDVAGFVFERQEHGPLRRLRPLPHRDDAAAACQLVVLKQPKVFRCREALAVQPLAQKRHRMLAQREAKVPVIGQRIL